MYELNIIADIAKKTVVCVMLCNVMQWLQFNIIYMCNVTLLRRFIFLSKRAFPKGGEMHILQNYLA